MESVSSLQYSTLSKQLTQEISKEIKKKEGIFFTPPSTVSRHLALLEPYFKNIKTVLEPCCGSGEFIRGLHQKYPHVKITGIEKNPTIVNSIKNLAGPHVNIMEDDFLNHQFSNLFDLIIGNPPFFVIRKKEVPEEYHPFFIGRPNIFILFILKSLSLLKESGILSFVLPKNFTNCLYYQPTRDLINDNYQIIALEKCHDKYLDTQQETILLILQKKNVRNNQQFKLSLNGYTLFETPESILQLKQLCTHSTCLQQLGFGVSVGTVVWNQSKDILTDDVSKTRLIYSSDIKDEQLVCQDFKNPAKKNYIKMKGKVKPVLVINRGYGVGKYHLEYCLIQGDFEYLIENHLMVISYTKGDLPQSQLLGKYRQIIKSFKDPRTIQFIELYFGNNAINTSELTHILPIYI